MKDGRECQFAAVKTASGHTVLMRRCILVESSTPFWYILRERLRGCTTGLSKQMKAGLEDAGHPRVCMSVYVHRMKRMHWLQNPGFNSMRPSQKAVHAAQAPLKPKVFQKPQPTKGSWYATAEVVPL